MQVAGLNVVFTSSFYNWKKMKPILLTKFSFWMSLIHLLDLYPLHILKHAAVVLIKNKELVIFVDKIYDIMLF